MRLSWFGALEDFFVVHGPWAPMIVGPWGHMIVDDHRIICSGSSDVIFVDFGRQSAPQKGSQSYHFMTPKRCPKNGMLSDPKCPPNLVFCVPCGPWKSYENVQLS